jgi:hypothetical protein
MRYLAPLAFVLLAACGTAPLEPKVEVREVRVPVPVACVPKSFPAAPQFPDSRAALLAAKGQDERYRLMAAGWMPRDARLAALEAQIKACR